MAVKSLDGYKLGIILDASQSAKGIAVLKEADALATKAQSSLSKLGHGVKFNLADQFKSELKEVDKLAGSSTIGVKAGVSAGAGFKDGFTSTLSSLLGTIALPGIGTAAGVIVGNAFNGIVSKVTGPLMGIIEGGINLNEQLELTKIHIEGITGSSDKAEQHLQALKKLSAQGFDLSMLLSADQRLEEFNKDLKVSEVELRAAAVASTVFGSGAAGFDSIADSLGLIAEKGELTSKTLTKLQKQGINVSGYLAKAFGISEKRVNALIKANRIKGDVAAQIISEELILDKGARADSILQNTGIGARSRYEAQSALLAAQGTENITTGMRDYYNLVNSILGSSQAKDVVSFINNSAGSLLRMVDGAIHTGVDATAGIIQGMLNPAGITAGVTTYVTSLIKELRGPAGFDSHSPSEKMKPIGEDAAEGVIVGFENFMATTGSQRLSASVNGLTARARAELLLQNPRVRAFLDVIKRSELGAGERNPYGRAFGSLGHRDPSTLSADGSNWPGMSVYSPTLHRTVQTHAFGAYQFEPGTYRGFAKMLGLTDVMPHSQDLAAVADLAQHPTALRDILSGNARGAMSSLGSEWESFAVNGPGKAASLDKLFSSLSVGGVAVSATNPVPVQVTGDLTGGVGQFVNPPPGDAAKPTNKLGFYQSNYAKSLNDTVKPLADVSAQQEQLPQVVGAGALSLASFNRMVQIVPPALAAANSGFLVLTKSADDLYKMGRKAAVGLDGVLGALEQAAGLLPSGGQVGKKRGFFSKLLGFAAPFLSFLPGGSILSTLATMDSNALAGNWQGVATGLAGGFSTGGVFRGTPSAGSTLGGALSGSTLGTVIGGLGPIGGGNSTGSGLPQRASGGPVRKGRAYMVGEIRPEVFTPDEDGWIHPSLESYGRSRGGARNGAPGGGARGGIEELIELLHAKFDEHTAAVKALHAKIASMPADHVVTVGAAGARAAISSAFMSHAASDPRVVEWMSRRVNGL